MKQKILIVIGALVICTATILAIYMNVSLEDTMDTMEFIAGRYRGGGQFVDYDNSIGVESSKNIGYWNKGSTWYVMYGKLELEFTKKDLQDKEILKAIAAIGLDVRGDLESNQLTWYWCGEELEEWVPQSR